MRTKMVCACLLLALQGCGEEPPPAELIRPVKAMRAQNVVGFQARSWPGRAEAGQSVDLAFEVSGQLQERPADVGDTFQKGEVLVSLDSRDFQNALQAATATRDQRRAYLGRISQAVKSGAVSQQDYTDARARLDVAEAEMRTRQKALDDATMRAPFPGTVSATYVDNFSNVRAKEKVLRYLDTSLIKFTINIPESLISNAPYVRGLEVRFDAIGERAFPASIKEVSNEASPTTRTYPVTLAIEPPGDVEILPGMAGEATATSIDLPDDLAQRGIEVPASALLTDDASDSQQSFVWVIDEGSMTVARREVEALGFTERGTLVRGLEPGEMIAAAGVHFLREGQKVRPQEVATQ